METTKLFSRIYGLCAGYAGGDPEFIAVITDRVLRKILPDPSLETDYELLCHAARHLVSELSKLPGAGESKSQNWYGSWPFRGHLLIALQALNGLNKDQRLLILLRDQWGLSIDDLAKCWQIPPQEMLERLKQTRQLWFFQRDLVLARKRRVT